MLVLHSLPNTTTTIRNYHKEPPACPSPRALWGRVLFGEGRRRECLLLAGENPRFFLLFLLFLLAGGVGRGMDGGCCTTTIGKCRRANERTNERTNDEDDIGEEVRNIQQLSYTSSSAIIICFLSSTIPYEHIISQLTYKKTKCPLSSPI
jgi:hypothetical protein